MQFRNEFVLGFSSVRHLVSLRFVLFRFYCGCVTRQHLPLSLSLAFSRSMPTSLTFTSTHCPCRLVRSSQFVQLVCLSVCSSPRWLCSYRSGLFAIWFCVFYHRISLVQIYSMQICGRIFTRFNQIHQIPCELCRFAFICHLRLLSGLWLVLTLSCVISQQSQQQQSPSQRLAAVFQFLYLPAGHTASGNSHRSEVTLEPNYNMALIIYFN